MSADGEYTLEMHTGGARLRGVMRLVSPTAYRSAFAALHDRLEATGDPFELDVSKLEFLNSSGITALSRLVMQARAREVPMVIVLDEGIPWQKKTLPSLAKLYPKIVLRGP